MLSYRIKDRTRHFAQVHASIKDLTYLEQQEQFLDFTFDLVGAIVLQHNLSYGS
jgi:hypothetical protein